MLATIFILFFAIASEAWFLYWWRVSAQSTIMLEKFQYGAIGLIGLLIAVIGSYIVHSSNLPFTVINFTFTGMLMVFFFIAGYFIFKDQFHLIDFLLTCGIVLCVFGKMYIAS